MRRSPHRRGRAERRHDGCAADAAGPCSDGQTQDAYTLSPHVGPTDKTEADRKARADERHGRPELADRIAANRWRMSAEDSLPLRRCAIHQGRRRGAPQARTDPRGADALHRAASVGAGRRAGADGRGRVVVRAAGFGRSPLSADHRRGRRRQARGSRRQAGRHQDILDQLSRPIRVPPRSRSCRRRSNCIDSTNDSSGSTSNWPRPTHDRPSSAPTARRWTAPSSIPSKAWPSCKRSSIFMAAVRRVGRHAAVPAIGAATTRPAAEASRPAGAGRFQIAQQPLEPGRRPGPNRSGGRHARSAEPSSSCTPTSPGRPSRCVVPKRRSPARRPALKEVAVCDVDHMNFGRPRDLRADLPTARRHSQLLTRTLNPCVQFPTIRLRRLRHDPRVRELVRAHASRSAADVAAATSCGRARACGRKSPRCPASSNFRPTCWPTRSASWRTWASAA